MKFLSLLSRRLPRHRLHCANLTEIVLAAALTDPVGLRFLSAQSDSEALIQAWNWGDDPIAPFLRRVCRENAAALLRIQTLMR